MTKNSKFLIITSIWGIVLMILPKINFYLYNNDFEITLLNGEKESIYYITWLIIYRYATPLLFCLSWWLLVNNWEFRKWVIPIGFYSLIGIFTTLISTKFYSVVVDLSFFTTILIMFFDDKKLLIINFLIFIISIIMSFSWYISLLKNCIYLSY